jgi:RHS repeat-associated protein
LGILPVSSGSAEHSLTYGYNASGRLASVTSPAGTFSYTYAPGSSLLESVTTPVHVVTNTWEPNRDVLDVKDNRIPSTTTPISSFNYGVNAIGQRTEVTTTGSAFPSQPADWTWGYDAFGQVTSADSSTNTFDRAYTYDQIGNRKKSADGELVTTGPSAITYDPNPLNQYSGVGAFSPTYDADGNQKDAQTLPLGSPSLVSCVYHWDAENRLIAVKDTNNADIVTYIYDSQSRRVARTQGANTTVYLYDGWNCLAEYTLHNSSFNLHTSLSWGLDLSGSLQGAGGVGGLLAVTEHQAENTTHFFPTYDGNGNVSEYLDAGGAVAAHYEYDPFGRVIVATGSQAADFAYRFSTKPRDAATGLYCYGYRWYDPDTGRWINRDPIEERGGVNLYGFVGNAPIFIYDILGLDYEMKIKGDSKLLNNKPQTRLMGAFLTKGQNYAEWEPQGAKSGNIPFPRNLANPNDTYSEIYLFLVTSNSRPTGKRPGEVQTPSGLEFEQDRRKEDWFYPHLTHIIKISIDPKSAEFKVDATANTTWGWEGAGEQPQNNEYIAVGSIFSASVADKNTLNLDYWGIGGWDPDYPIIMKGGPLSATRGPLAKNAGPLDMAQGPGVPGGGVFPHKQSKTGWGFPDGVYPEVVWDTKGTLEEIKKAKKRQVGLPWDPHRSPWPGGLRTNGPLGSIQFSLECVKK